MTTQKIKIKKVVGRKALYCRYRSDDNPQPAHVELDCVTGELTCDYNAESKGSKPIDVYHGHRIWWDISCYTTTTNANKLLKQIAPLAQVVLDGYESEWDGRNNVAVYTDKATKMIDRIDQICRQAM